MKTRFYLIIVIGILAALVFLQGHPPAALETAREPRISITAADQPLGEVLDQITAETGYQFNLDPRWEDHRVSAAFKRIGLERGLKRLLRSLNHSIIWESDRTVTIVVYGKSEPGRDQGAVSFAPPPQEVLEDPEPNLEPQEELSDQPETEEIEPPTAEDAPLVEAADTGE
jgi:hypothetical protein